MGPTSLRALRPTREFNDTMADVLAGAAASWPRRYILPQHNDVFVVQPGLDYYLDRLARLDYFAFVKRSHCYWDLLIDLCNVDPLFARMVRDVNRGVAPPNTAANYIRRLRLSPQQLQSLEDKRPYKHFWEGGFFQDITADLRCDGYPRIIEANALEAFTEADATVAAAYPLAQLREVLIAVDKPNRADIPHHDSLVFKDNVATGRLWEVLDAIRSMHIIVVGPDHLVTLATHADWTHFEHIVIPTWNAIGARQSILAQTRSALERAGATQRPTVVLFQAGTLAWWMTYRLLPAHPNCFYLDLGRALDIFFPTVALQQNWVKNDLIRLVTAMKVEHLYRTEIRVPSASAQPAD
jgi:hypothetical protein